MTRKGSTKTVDTSFGAGRLSIARAYLKAARNELLVADANDIGNPAMSQIVNAAIAFSDALTATHARKVNQKNHAASVETLRDALGNRFPDAQETNLRRILDEKDAVQYGTVVRRKSDAEALLVRLETFAAWAESEMKR